MQNNLEVMVAGLKEGCLVKEYRVLGSDILPLHYMNISAREPMRAGQ
jgi:hypothetical protein